MTWKEMMSRMMQSFPPVTSSLPHFPLDQFLLINMVKEIASKEEFDKVIAESGDKLVVVDYTASWCG